MQTLTIKERRYRREKLNCVRHITLDPKGPGVVRIHMIPPKTERKEDPFLLLVNGAQLVPLNLSWAVLLADFMDVLSPFAGREIPEGDWNALAERTVEQTAKTYPHTDKTRIRQDLDVMISSLIAIARGEEPPAEVGMLALGDYADHMASPHRMDLMVSAMTKEGAWHCNQKCLHCYAAGQKMAQTGELTTVQWKEVLHKLRQAGVPQVTFTGGEPTMRPDLTELVDAAAWFVTRLNTNGRLLTRELCHKLYEASLDSVQVTFYSADAAVHNQLVGVPGFEETVQGICHAVEAGLNVSINTPLCSLNRDYAATLRFASSLGVRYATCSGLIPAGGAEGTESQATRLSPEALTACLKEAMTAARELETEVDFTSPGWLSEDILRSLGLTLIPSCGACLSNMAVAPDGTVVPCQSWLGGVTLGQMLSDDWQHIWESQACRSIRAKSAKMEHICQLHTGNRGKESC
ncbi:MAG: radical SAM protein [Clostridiales bacterium]|nr:radical SAM protein [Clostridiales bacterium]